MIVSDRSVYSFRIRVRLVHQETTAGLELNSIRLWIGFLFIWAFALFRPSSCRAAEFVLLYTGDTRSFLEVCGCRSNQLGGVARRATVVRNLRYAHPEALLLDAGGLFHGHSELDGLRCAVHLLAMAEMGYDAANLGVGEFRFGRGFLEAQRDISGVPFTSANLQTAARGEPLSAPFRILEASGIRVGVVGLAGKMQGTEAVAMGHEKAPADFALRTAGIEILDAGVAVSMALKDIGNRADFSVVLSDLSPDENRRLVRRAPGIGAILGCRERAPVEEVGGVVILGTLSQGKAVGQAVLKVEDGRVTEHQVEQIYIGEEIVEDEQVSRLVEDFYLRVRSAPELQRAASPGFEGRVLEETVLRGENGYTGADACRACHPAEYADWRVTRHAGANDRLLREQRHFHPDCATCHTTGFGYPTGFRIGEDDGRLEGVQCETCHGPGGRHVRRPERLTIRGKVPADICRGCHTPEQTPDIEGRMAAMWGEIDHSAPRQARAGPAEEAIADGLMGGVRDRVRVELFVMAHCPYGIQAEAALAPAIEAFAERVDFRLHFIAEEGEKGGARTPTARKTGARRAPGCAGVPTAGAGRFRSLHGDAEVEEGIRQAVMMTLYPDRYYRYILCRNNRLDSDGWEACATEAGMDAAHIAATASSREGEAIFSRNIRRANLLGIDASPTLRVNGEEIEAFFDPGALARRICRADSGLAACETFPACGSDRDCSRPGKVGVCIGPDGPDARCRFSDPVPFQVTVLNDPACAVCETGHFIRSTMAFFPGARFHTLDIGSPEGRALAARYGIDRVPAFLLDEAFGRTARFGRFEHAVRRVTGGYLPSPRMVPVARLLNREEKPGRLDLFLGTASPLAMGIAGQLTAWLENAGVLDRLHVHYMGEEAEGGQGENLWHLCVQKALPDRYLDYLLCRIRGTTGGQEGLSSEDCLEKVGLAFEEVRRCATGTEGALLLARARETASEFGVRSDINPTLVIDNRIVVTVGLIQQGRDLFYRMHPELFSREGNALEDSGR